MMGHIIVVLILDGHRWQSRSQEQYFISPFLGNYRPGLAPDPNIAIAALMSRADEFGRNQECHAETRQVKHNF